MINFQTCRVLIAFVLLLVVSFLRAQTTDYPIQPVPFTQVNIADQFWSHRLEVNRVATIPYAFQMCESTGRIKNFEIADSVITGQITEGKFCSRYGFDDSDVYKIIEGAAYSLHTHPDPALDKYLDAVIAKIAAAQESDGYLYTMRTIKPAASWASERWVNDRAKSSHELYNLGHLYEAAVAHYYATGKSTLLDVAIKSANLLCNTFGPDKMHTVPGHQVTEIGLVKLFRVTGDQRYLDLARFFLDERGRGNQLAGQYNQDLLPVVEQTEAVGHAVRAGYMYAGMADIGALMHDTAYIKAIDRIWENLVTKKYYLTGGVGAAGDWEGFGPDYALPNLTAYNETCAAIAMVYWNHRMFLLHGDSKYIDVLERTLYNGVLSGIALDGKTFFYPNPLESRGNYKRSEWFACACCPSNVTRFIASVGGYAYAQRRDSLYVNLFIGGKTNLALNGRKVEIMQETEYPWQGDIKITVNPSARSKFALCIRIPGWAQNQPVPGDLYTFFDRNDEKPSVQINGKTASLKMAKGYAVLNATWQPGDVVRLHLPMPVRRVIANEKVKDDKGKVALQRGPLVFCAEGVDNGGEVSDIIIPATAKLQTTYRADLLNGVMVLSGRGLKLAKQVNMTAKTEGDFQVIPYYAWCHRGAGNMTVWFHSDRTVFPPEMTPTSTLFLDNVTVRLAEYVDQEIRYTLDGTKPNRSSSLYTQPLTISGDRTTLQAMAFGKNGFESEIESATYTKAQLLAASPRRELAAGLEYKYYEGDVDSLPNFSLLQPKKSGHVDSMNVTSMREVNDHYLLLFSGYLEVPKDDVYTFYTYSDDGSRLWIDDHEVVNNDGTHGAKEKSGQIALQAGHHKLTLAYFDYAGVEVLRVYYSAPGLVKQMIPATRFYRLQTKGD
ncbi:MAG: hypothetical protein ALAOOOJD_03572 [bacterium]|nr:hypothetical protein [bacterium]